MFCELLCVFVLWCLRRLWVLVLGLFFVVCICFFIAIITLTTRRISCELGRIGLFFVLQTGCVLRRFFVVVRVLLPLFAKLRTSNRPSLPARTGSARHGRYVPALYDLARGAGWEPYNLPDLVADVSCVWQVLYGSCTTSHDGRIGSTDDLDRDQSDLSEVCKVAIAGDRY